MNEQFSNRREVSEGREEVGKRGEVKEDSEALNEKVVSEMERAGFDSVKVDTRGVEIYKNESIRSMDEREYLPDGHPEKETKFVGRTFYTFEYRGLKCDYIPFTEGNVLRGAVNVEGADTSSMIRASDLSSLIMKVKKSVNERDPNYPLELMEKEGFQDVKFDGKDESDGLITYSFSLKAGVKGDFKVVPGGGGIRMACNIYFGGNGSYDFGFLENASTLDEVVSKIKNHIKIAFLDKGIEEDVF